MMNRNHMKIMTGVILAALVATTMAPAAEAGRRHKERSKPVYAPWHQKHRPERVVRYVYRGPRVVQHYHRYDGGHSGLAFLGGLVLGAVITNAHASHADPYFYADPYCDVRFSSLDAYHSHLRYQHHPRIVHVISVSSGDWVDSYAWYGSGWRHYETERWECGWDD